jgi:cytosine/adenosine deaminase-related metal-dependent hydrolase
VAAHLDDQATLIRTICDGRAAIEEGDVADLVLVPASSLDDALARRPGGRVVFKGGRQVAGDVVPGVTHEGATRKHAPS